MSIFTITKSPLTQEIVLIPLRVEDANSIYEMLESAFPYRRETYHLNLWDFHLCSWDGDDDAIIFH